MAINTRTEYALRALLEIMNNKAEPVSASEICRKQELPKKYIEHLLSGLRTAGFISSTSGSKGGYVLSKPAEQIGLYDIMLAVEDTSWDLSCNSKGNKYCIGAGCLLHSLWDDVSVRMQTILQDYTLQAIYSLTTKKGKK